MFKQIRSSARLRAAGQAALRASVLVVGFSLLPGAVSLAQDDEAAKIFDDMTWRERSDRPVLGFTRGPAGLLLTPQEQAKYAALTDRVERFKFIERFWFDVAGNCPDDQNPVRDEFWERAELASQRYSGSGLPGWLTDPGRVLLLVGEPDEQRETTASIEGRSRGAQVWTWSQPGDGPRSVLFIRDPFGWRLAALDVDASSAAITLNASDVPSLEVTTERFASVFRAKGCELTPEQMAEVKSRGWRTTLFDATSTLLEGGQPDADGSLMPEWLFFPAQDGATFATVSFSLDKMPPEEKRLVVMLRDEESSDDEASYVLGTGDFAFEYRESGGKVIARAARSLPPGRYKLAAAWVAGEDQVEIGHAGSQIVARVTDESLRLTSVLLASKLEKAAAAPPGPFALGGYKFTPATDNVFRSGETFYMLFQAVGATANASGQADVTVKYTLHGKHPQRGWVPIGAPQTETNPGGVRVREVPIPKSYPPTDYKWQIDVTDNATGQSVSREVSFTVVRS